jgi:hypothetical protein
MEQGRKTSKITTDFTSNPPASSSIATRRRFVRVLVGITSHQRADKEIKQMRTRNKADAEDHDEPHFRLIQLHHLWRRRDNPTKSFRHIVGLDWVIRLVIINDTIFVDIFARSSDRIALLINRVPLTIFKLPIYSTPYRLTAASYALVTSG